MDSQTTTEARSGILCAVVGISAATDREISQSPDVSGKQNGLSGVRQSEDEIVLEGDCGPLRHLKAPHDAYSPLYICHDNHAGEQCKVRECVEDARSYQHSNDTPLRPQYERIPRPGDEQSGRDYGGLTINCSSVILVQYYGEGYPALLVVF